MVELVGRGSVINRDTTTSLNIRVDFDGRWGEDSEAQPACTQGLDPAPAHAPSTAHAPATVHKTIHCQPTIRKVLP